MYSKTSAQRTTPLPLQTNTVKCSHSVLRKEKKITLTEKGQFYNDKIECLKLLSTKFEKYKWRKRIYCFWYNIGITLEYKRKKVKKKKSYFPKTAKRSEIHLRSKIQVNRIHFL